MWIRILCVLLLGPALWLGCSSQPDRRPKTVPVTVTVTFRGEPIEGVTVALLPPKPTAPDVYAASGTTDADGIAQPVAFREKPGVVPGEYLVTISGIKSTELPKTGNNISSVLYQHRALVPMRYADTKTSGLKATIREDELNDLTFSLVD